MGILILPEAFFFLDKKETKNQVTANDKIGRRCRYSYHYISTRAQFSLTCDNSKAVSCGVVYLANCLVFWKSHDS
jgi:hypothetical protein